MGRKDRIIGDEMLLTPGARLRRARQAKGISLTEMAKLLLYSKGYISSVENGIIASPSQELVEQYERVLGLQAGELMISPQKVSPKTRHIEHHLWSVPHHRNPFFTGRQEIIKYIHEELIDRNKPPHILAITGLGGIGKTQVAVQYAYEHETYYRGVFWLKAFSPEVLETDFLDIADIISSSGLGELNGKSSKDIKQWLRQNSPCLVIIDGLDNPENIPAASKLLLHLGETHVIVTTRLQTLGTLAQPLELKKMSIEEGTLFLLRRVKSTSIENPSSNIPAYSQAQAIVRAMDGLPLALDQAGSYIAGNSCTLSHYLDLFRKEQSRLLEERGVSFTDHPQSVAATWALALEEVKHANPIAIELLHLCVFLDPDSIHRDIFIEGASVLGPLLRPTAKDPISLDQTLGELRKYSIISDSLDAGVLTIHRLLLSVIKSTMNPEDQHLWAERAVRAVNCVFPRIDPPNVEEVDASSWAEARSVCRRYFPHAQVCAQLIQERRLVFIEAAQLLGKLARYLEEISAFGDAKRHYRDMLSMNEEIGTVEPSQLIVAHNDVATFYEKRGENKEALTSYEEGIKVVGIGHPSAEMTELLSNYATLLERMGRRSEASKVKEHLTERLQQKKIRAITINDDNGEIKYYGEWIPRKSGEEENPQLRTYGGSTHYTEKENSSFTYTFSGIGIAILSDTVSAQGKIEIFIDDRYMQGRDTTLPESEQLPQSVVFHHVKLKRGNHTIRVELVEGSFALGALTIFDVSENAL